MNAVIWLCLYFCTIIPLTWCAETTTDTSDTTPDQTSTAGKDLPPSPDDGAKKIVMRITIVLFIVCVIVGLYFIWRCSKSRPNVRTKAGGNNYRRVRSSMPAGDMGGERGEDGEDEETLYDRTESTSQF